MSPPSASSRQMLASAGLILLALAAAGPSLAGAHAVTWTSLPSGPSINRAGEVIGTFKLTGYSEWRHFINATHLLAARTQ